MAEATLDRINEVLREKALRLYLQVSDFQIEPAGVSEDGKSARFEMTMQVHPVLESVEARPDRGASSVDRFVAAAPRSIRPILKSY